jgi:hypothetical protein
LAEMPAAGMTPIISRNSKASRNRVDFSSPTSRLSAAPVH